MILLTIFTVLILFLFHELYWKRRNLPPGPTPLPLIGNLFTVFWHEPGYSAFEMWKEQYGPVYTYWLGMYPLVMVSDYPSLLKTFIKDGDGYTDKFRFEEATKMFRGGEYGVIDTVGDIWREHRRFVLNKLRDFGLGKGEMEQRILLEVEELTKTLDSQHNEANVPEAIEVAVGSVINQLLFGYRFDDQNLSEFLYLKKLISEQMKISASPVLILCFTHPWLKSFWIFKKCWEKVMFYRDEFYGFFGRQISVHEKNIDYTDDQSTDFVEAFLKEKRKKDDSGQEHTFSIIQLENLCLDLWFAGMETSSNTLSWIVIYLLNHPEIQTKLHEELDKVIGNGRQVCMEDKLQLPYTCAVVNEGQRLANLLPMNLPHLTSRDVDCCGYKLKKGTGVVAQISTVLYDKNVFPEPQKFKPERFLDADGNIKKVDELCAFSVGKRQCLGESLARMELFLFTANIFNRFQFGVHGTAPSMKKTFGTTVRPEEYRCTVTSRF